VDEEGGVVTQFSPGFTQMPGNLAIGAARSEAGAFDCGNIVGYELSELGITMNWAPVVDLNNPLNRVIDVRSFGDEAETVSRLGIAMAKGLNAGGVGATAKHFPGLGNTVLRSDNMYIYVNSNDREFMMEHDLVPFRELSRSGIDAIMTGPIAAPAFENGQIVPAAVSRHLLTDVLRRQFQYDGVIFAEDLECGLGAYTIKKAAQLSVTAGADMIILCHSKTKPLLAYNGLLNAVRKGKIKEERINESVRRILRLKLNIENYRKNRKPLSPIEINRKLERLSSDTVMVLSDPKRLIPLDKSVYKKILVVLPKLASLSNADVSETIRCTLGEHLSSEFGSVKIMSVALNPSPAETDAVLQAAHAVDLVVVATENSNEFPEYLRLLHQIAECRPTVVVSLRNPYETLYFPENATVVLAYSPIGTSMEIVKDVLSGHQEARGSLPIRLSDYKRPSKGEQAAWSTPVR